MGNRLSKIYTRTGDDGTTGMADGSRISKADLRFDAMGKIDLLNSQIGLLRGYLTQASHGQFDDNLSRLQHQLFNLGGELAMPEYRGILAEYVIELENQIDELVGKLYELDEKHPRLVHQPPAVVGSSDPGLVL